MPDLSVLFDLQILMALLAGTIWGVVMGVLPGVTGLTALVMAVPIAVTLDPLPGLVLLISIHAVADVGGAVTAIALAIPGTPSNMATVEDGHALAQSGHTSRAIAASSFASAFGGVGGFLLMVISLPFSLALVRTAGAPEILAVCILGLISAARLGSATLWQGLAALGAGLFLGLIGTQGSTGFPRLWFGLDGLLDGLHIIAVATGLFAGPELLRLVFSADTAHVDRTRVSRAVSQGFRDVVQRPWIVMQSSLIGWLVGILPGVGGSVASFLAYSASGISRHATRDVKSRLDGVVAAEASNNAKEGGDIIPTLTLGLPGGAGMAVLVGAFMMMGVAPGPGLLVAHPEIGVAAAFALLAANILGGVLVAYGSPLFLMLLNTPKVVLAPGAICLAVIGVLGARGSLFDLWTVAAFSVLGVLMLTQGFSRPALMIGFVLAPVIETYASISYAAYGWSLFVRLGVISVVVAGGAIFLILKAGPFFSAGRKA